MSDTETVQETEEEAVEEKEPVEAPEETSEETPEEATEETPEDTSEEPAPKSKRNVQKRISQLTQQRSQAQQEAATLRQQLEALQSQSQPAAEPKQEDFQSFDDFAVARAEFRARETVRQELGALSKAVQQSQGQAEQAARTADWDLKAEDARDRYDDFDDVVLIDTNPVSPAMAQAYAEADNGADVAYHIASNPKLAREISGLSPMQAVIRIGRISQKLGEKPKPKPTAAPKPVKTVTGGGTSSRKSLSQMSQREFEAEMDKREKR